MLDFLKMSAVPLNDLYVLRQKVWLQCQVLLSAQINPQSSDPDLGPIFVQVEKSHSLMPYTLDSFLMFQGQILTVFCLVPSNPFLRCQSW